MTGKRKSYKASTRRHRKREDGTEELGDFSDEEDGESLERKIARLRREIEEIKEEAGKRRTEKLNAAGKQDGHDGDSSEVDEDDAAKLSHMLDSISMTQSGKINTSSSKLAKALSSNLPSFVQNPATITPQKPSNPTTYTVTYAPEYQQNRALVKAADFDSRLTLIERALGISSVAEPAIDVKGAPLTILPTLDALQRQVLVLSESSPSSLDSISRRVRTLTQETERLDEARKSAKKAQDDLREVGGDVKVGNSNDLGDSEQVAKINALYGTLATIETLSPLLPSLLDRLRSLRAIHADAAIASQNLERVAKRQEDLEAEIKKWRQGLEKVEETMKQGEKTMGVNMKVVEGWVKELEQKMAIIGN